MEYDLKKIIEHLDGVPTRRVPIGKNAWLQEWDEAQRLVERFELTIREYLKAEQENHNNALEMEDSFNRDETLTRSWGRIQLLKEILGER